ncbi:3-deoxy-manno-octulosonate cytidylyltransferase [Fulvimarina sp. 2208YS6-2-32]|uniref:3-deoxy-manno-octulosonate cytidylyltransferase n=1 Tax=Fulvimarina uroteuthidis TaxID=3098149 RepID=A0ABU5I5M5_9HYPH|nr:3-deoxy-manno-octulosonate cytidylyltransferase [Fulvimarina sp. 2208YS6-2-32]MDY8110701.1 3-deoxy-manno-octulosonate cytidylyltransferase [Fulvimarina sp. 2208YS6-2-32]
MAQWFARPDEWQRYFEGYRRIVLIANSDAVEIAAAVRRHGRDALYVFFNKVYKVLDAPFAENALLVARSSPVGANIVYRREVADILRFFPPDRFAGVLNLACDDGERFSGAEEFGGRRAGQLQLAAYFDRFYPLSHKPTSGFALAVWLAETTSCEVHLEGFTAKRSLQWKLFADHDWIYEQTCLRLLARSGRLQMAGIEPVNAYAELGRRFPDISGSDIAATGLEVLASRAENTSVAIERLFSLTRLQGRLDRFLRDLKPRTRKEKAIERASKGDRSA